MAYVRRDEGQNIVGVYTALQPGYAEEWLEDGSPELTSESKEVRIAKTQAAYDSDLEKLNKAWLAALIADGSGEAARQAVIKSQMEELDVQLEMDIVAIIMEE